MNYAVGMYDDTMSFGDRVIVAEDLDKATAKAIVRHKNATAPFGVGFFLIDWVQEYQEADEAFGRMVMVG